MRAAVVIEQCWHRVPGGTATAVLDQVAAVAATGRVDQVGVAARHRRAAPRAVAPGASRSATCRCPAWRSTGPWHRWPLAAGRAGHRPRRRRPRHRLRHPAPHRAPRGHAARPRLAPRPVDVHPQRRAVLRGRPALRARRRRPGAVPVPGDARGLRGRRHRPRSRLRHVPWGMTIVDVADGEVAAVRAALRHHRPLRAVGRHARAPQEPARACSRRSPACPSDDVTLVVVGPDGWGESPADRGRRGWGRACGSPGFVPSAAARASLRWSVGGLLSEPVGGLRPARGRGDGRGRAGRHVRGHGHRGAGGGRGGPGGRPLRRRRHRRRDRAGARRRRPGRPPAGGRAGAGRPPPPGRARPRRRSPPTRRCWGGEGRVQPAVAGARERSAAPRRPPWRCCARSPPIRPTTSS